MVAQTAEFKKAAEDVKNLTQKPNNDELLELYGLYKQGTGEDFAKAEKPGMFDLKGKAKHSAWEKVKDVKPDEAQKKYIEVVKKLQAKDKK